MDIQFHSKPAMSSDCTFLVGKLFSRGREVSRVDVELEDAGCAWIIGVYTESKFRGQGYAGHLLCCLLQKYNNACREWRLSVNPYGDVPLQDVAPLNREQLIAFYSRLGFELLSNAVAPGSPVMRLTQAKLKTRRFKHHYPALSADFFD